MRLIQLFLTHRVGETFEGKTMKARIITIAAVLFAVFFAIAGTANAGPIQPWGTVITGSGGGQIEVTHVKTGPGVTVFSLTFTPGNKPLQGYDILTPTLTAMGRPVAVDYGDLNTGSLWSGVVPPHGHVTLDYAYKVNFADLNPATLTVGIGLDDFTWTGNVGDVWKQTPATAGMFGSS